MCEASGPGTSKPHTGAVHVRVHSLPSSSTLCELGDCSPPTPLSMGFPRQEYWSGLPFLHPGDLPDPGIEPMSPAVPALQVVSLPLRSPRECNWS